MRSITGAIFDMDGTVLDSMPIWENAGSAYLTARGVTPEPGLYEKLRSLSGVQVSEYFRSVYGLRESAKEITDGINLLVRDFYFYTAKPKHGVTELLDRLRKTGVRICAATATDRHLIEASLERNGIFRYFERVFTCSEVNAEKDRPDVYLEALRFMGTDIRTTYVFEDALYAVLTAKRAGFPVAAVYDASARAQQDELRKAADIYLRTFEDWEETK